MAKTKFYSIDSDEYSAEASWSHSEDEVYWVANYDDCIRKTLKGAKAAVIRTIQRDMLEEIHRFQTLKGYKTKLTKQIHHDAISAYNKEIQLVQQIKKAQRYVDNDD